MPKTKNIQVLIPAFNCEETIGEVIAQVLEQGLPVTVVDDGSQDRTAAVARAAGAHLLYHPVNRGKGHALVTGFTWALAAHKEGVLTLDGDGQHDPADLPRLLTAGEQAQLVMGQRRINKDQMPTASFIGNCVSTFFISLFCGQHFPDTQCGYRLYSRTLLEQLPLAGGRFETETELLMRASLGGMTIRWVPVQTIYPHGTTAHHTNFRNTADSLRVITVVLRSLAFSRRLA